MIANILLLGSCWIFLLIVWGSIALRRWYQTEAEDAARTEAVMKSLLGDTTNSHIEDAI